jgi:hypothetical protein
MNAQKCLCAGDLSLLDLNTYQSIKISASLYADHLEYRILEKSSAAIILYFSSQSSLLQLSCEQDNYSLQCTAQQLISNNPDDIIVKSVKCVFSFMDESSYSLWLTNLSRCLQLSFYSVTNLRTNQNNEETMHLIPASNNSCNDNKKSAAAPLLSASVYDTEKHYNSSGKVSYMNYNITVQTGQLKWQVNKRFSDFHNLHKVLNAKYQHNKTLEGMKLPKKTLTGQDSMNLTIINERTKLFNQYLKDLLNEFELCSSAEALQFLGMLDNSSDNSLSIENCLEYVNTGDILLVRNDNSLANIQRTITRAEFDHVALVTRKPITSTSKHSLCIVEAIGAGVRCIPAQTLLRDW